MADEAVVHIGENSPEHVAYTMAKDVLFRIEDKKWNTTTREELLQTYAECIYAVKGYRNV